MFNKKMILTVILLTALAGYLTYTDAGADKPSIDNENWLAFCNCKYDRNTGEWEMIKRPVKYITQ